MNSSIRLALAQRSGTVAHLARDFVPPAPSAASRLTLEPPVRWTARDSPSFHFIGSLAANERDELHRRFPGGGFEVTGQVRLIGVAQMGGEPRQVHGLFVFELRCDLLQSKTPNEPLRRGANMGAKQLLQGAQPQAGISGEFFSPGELGVGPDVGDQLLHQARFGCTLGAAARAQPLHERGQSFGIVFGGQYLVAQDGGRGGKHGVQWRDAVRECDGGHVPPFRGTTRMQFGGSNEPASFEFAAPQLRPHANQSRLDEFAAPFECEVHTRVAQELRRVVLALGDVPPSYPEHLDIRREIFRWRVK
jgi:hypothetical protein